MSKRGATGWVGIPRAWFESVRRGELTVEQLGISVLLAGEGNYREPTVVDALDGRTYPVGFAEAIIGRRRFAERYRMGKGGRDRVTRALERGNALGLWAAGPAQAAPPPAPPPAPGCAPPPAPPPTLVSFKKDAEILFRPSEAAPPPAPPLDPPCAPPPAPIQQVNLLTTEPRNTEKLLPSPAASARRKRESPTDPRFAPMREAWERLFAADRREPYRWQGPKDSKAIHALIAVPLADFEARATRGLKGQAFLRCSTVAQLNAKWNDLAGPVAAANGAPRAGAPVPAMAASAFTDESGGF
jgi:hypothetical protein